MSQISTEHKKNQIRNIIQSIKKQINYTLHSQQKKYKQSVHICFKCLVSPLAIGEMKILAVIPLWVSGENKYESH